MLREPCEISEFGIIDARNESIIGSFASLGDLCKKFDDTLFPKIKSDCIGCEMGKGFQKKVARGVKRFVEADNYHVRRVHCRWALICVKTSRRSKNTKLAVTQRREPTRVPGVIG